MAARLPDPLSEHAVANGMFRALAWLRVVVTLNLLFFNLAVRADFVHPRAALVVVVLVALDRLRRLGVRRGPAPHARSC
jgi:hypothetical protein